MIPILIPSLNPDEKLIKLIKALKKVGLNTIIIINDGSDKKYTQIFNNIQKKFDVIILKHAINLGKGRALKTGINYAILNYNSNLTGIVTVDADGQHTPKDVLHVYKQLAKKTNTMILGTRKFVGKVPLKSRLGNSITAILFGFLTGLKLKDTQTGLRGIPYIYLNTCLQMEGERYDYEMNMLLNTSQHNIKLEEIDIETVYINDNKSSHFKPLTDSLKIYRILFRFFFSSFSTSIIDYLIFLLCINNNLSLLESMIVARFIAGNYNFIVNNKLVFNNNGKIANSFLKYWFLVLTLGMISYFSIDYLNRTTQIDVVYLKVGIETILIFMSYYLQKNLVFINKKNAK